MKNAKWIPFYHGDWLAGVAGLTSHEMGVYIQLLMLMYETGEPLQASESYLARKCGTTKARFQGALTQLIATGKIIQDDAGLWNPRTRDEISRRTSKSQAAKDSAARRWQTPQSSYDSMPMTPDSHAVGQSKSSCDDSKSGSNPLPNPDLPSANASHPQDGGDAIQDRESYPPKAPPENRKLNGKLNGKLERTQGNQSETPQVNFADFWALYPKRDGANPRHPAEIKFQALPLADKTAALAGVRPFAAQWSQSQADRKLVPQAKTWLSQKRWRDLPSPDDGVDPDILREARRILGKA